MAPSLPPTPASYAGAAQALEPEEARRLASRLMRRQAALGVRVAAAFLTLVLGLPLVNAYAPELGTIPVVGFPLSWFILAIAFYPITWALSWAFVCWSERMEAEDAATIRRGRRGE